MKRKVYKICSILLVWMLFLEVPGTVYASEVPETMVTEQVLTEEIQESNQVSESEEDTNQKAQESDGQDGISEDETEADDEKQNESQPEPGDQEDDQSEEQTDAGNKDDVVPDDIISEELSANAEEQDQTPDIPENIVAESDSYLSVIIFWDAVEDAEGYELWRSGSEDGEYELLTTVPKDKKEAKQKVYTDKNLTMGKTYWYKIRSYKKVKETQLYSEYTAPVSAAPQLSTVENLEVKATRYNTIQLTWDKVTGAGGYEIYYAQTEDGPYSLLKSVTRNNYKFTKAVCGQTYYFKVRGWLKKGKEVWYSSCTEPQSCATELAVSELSIYKVTYNSLSLKWNKVTGAMGYEIYVSDSETGIFEKLALVKRTTYVHKKLELGKVYYYKIRAVRKDYVTAFSEIVKGSPAYERLSGLKAVGTSTSTIKISWRRVLGLTYVVERYNTEADAKNRTKMKKSIESDSASVTDEDLRSGKTYYYMVYGKKGDYETEAVGPVKATTKQASTKRGIDVSEYQGSIDWNSVNADFAIIRAGYRGSTFGSVFQDRYFERNIKGALNNGIPVGVYFYTQAISTDEAREEAQFVLKLVGKYNIRYPIYVDTEASTGKNGRADNLSRTVRTQIIKAFCDEIQNNGYKAGVYASKSWFENRLIDSELSDYEIWVAQYNSECTYNGKYGIWQYTSKGSMAGIKGNVDMDICYKSY